MKIPFDIIYRPQIESGEYKVILDCGVEAEILAWDKPGEYPIVCIAKKEGAVPFRTDNNGIAYHYPEGSNYSDLFIVTPEPEMSEFEMAIYRRSNFLTGEDLSETELLEETKEMAVELLDLAKQQLLQSGELLTQEHHEKLMETLCEECKKDLPRWREWRNGACGNSDGHPIALVAGYGGIRFVSVLGTTGEKYIMLNDLKKLPGFKDDESHE